MSRIRRPHPAGEAGPEQRKTEAVQKCTAFVFTVHLGLIFGAGYGILFHVVKK